MAEISAPIGRFTCTRCGHQGREYLPMQPANWLRLGALIRYKDITQVGRELATLCGACAESFFITFLEQGVEPSA